MAGHNKWSKIKRLKAVTDAKKGRVFSRYSKEIAVSVRLAGADPTMNPRLRAAIQGARSENMPNENIDRAIRKGSGEGSNTKVVECLYEGYGPSGVAILIEAATDNKNRTAPDLRRILGDYGGNLAASGSTSYLFQRLGIIEVQANPDQENQILEAVLDAGGEDCIQEENLFLITTPPDRLSATTHCLEERQFKILSSKLTFTPQTTIATNEETTCRIEELCEALEELDDVLAVHNNLKTD